MRCAGKALDILRQCTEHTPTLIELYTVKAKILKHAGDIEGAAAAADKARSMDLADRWDRGSIEHSAGIHCRYSGH